MFNSYAHNGNYTCICGRNFSNSQSFNGHKSHCKEHQLNKYGSLDKLIDSDKRRTVSDKATKRHKAIEYKKEKLNQWISEQHICETCGKVMKKYYGSGRFCSRYCVDTRKNKHSEETKEKIRKFAKENPRGWADPEWRLNHPESSAAEIKRHSKRELEIVDYFKINFPNDDWKQGFVKHCKIGDCYLNPDLHSDKSKIVIEYDGIWHFKDIHNQLEYKQTVDRLMLKWCKKHNYRLIRIDEDLNLAINDIVDAVYNKSSEIELFGSARYGYLFSSDSI